MLALKHAFVGRAHGLPRSPLRMCVILDGVLNALLMDHIALGCFSSIMIVRGTGRWKITDKWRGFASRQFAKRAAFEDLK
jgi:hypothetical protein